MNRALILANGKPPARRLLKQHLASADWFICADGGANTAARFHCVPDLIIGDLDSIKTETLAAFRKIKIIKLKDQNSTDLEKALAAAVRKNMKEISVLGATGGRLDHAMGNLSALVKFSHLAQITFIEPEGIFFSIDHAMEFHPPAGTLISLLPLSRCSGIVTHGLKWNLKNEALELGIRESTSNIVVSSPVRVSVRKGRLVAFIRTGK